MDNYFLKLTKLLFSVLLALQTISLISLSHAQSAEFSLSLLSTGEESLEKKITFPETDGDIDVSIRCLAWISTGGQYDANWCFPADLARDRDFIRSIHRATISARNTPAVHEGSSVRVYFNYRVTFTKIGETSEVKVYPNDGADTEKYGENYYSPQAVELNRIFPNLDIKDCLTRSNRTDLLAITARVGAYDGLPLETSIVNAFRCRNAWQDFADQRKYIPAFTDESYVESTITQQYWLNTDVRRRIVYPRDSDTASPLDLEMTYRRALPARRR